MSKIDTGDPELDRVLEWEAELKYLACEILESEGLVAVLDRLHPFMNTGSVEEARRRIADLSGYSEDPDRSLRDMIEQSGVLDHDELVETLVESIDGACTHQILLGLSGEEEYGEILSFWFQELSPKSWFNGGEEVDRQIRERFSQLIEEIHRGEHDGWLEEPRGRLAAVIALDQFPRNIYRGEARSFSYDERALRLVLEGIAQRIDDILSPHQRAFFYLPLEHSEIMVHQDLSMERFARLASQVEPPARDPFRNYLRYAWRHYEIVQRFGRYPHRNAILGRKSSDREARFLTQPGSSFL